MFFEDTIAAISTPIGVGGVSVIRICGKDALSIADRLFHSSIKPSESKSHSLHFGNLIDPASKEVLDSVLLGIMKEPRSYTGFDTVEISCHGGVLNSKKILETVLQSGARIAEPGEFTKIAFLNGKMDLSQIEAVADLIHAKTDGARRSSMSQFMGSLSKEVFRLKGDLIQLCSLLELDLDFSEENLLEIESPKIVTQIESVEKKIQSLLGTYTSGHLIREGVKVSIFGKPNVGKSSLLNALLKKQRSIVSDQPGTTRDYIEESLEIDGIPFVFVDTAGIRTSTDDIEHQGVTYSKESIDKCDLILAMFDSSKSMDQDDFHLLDLIAKATQSSESIKTLYVLNKSDNVQKIELDKIGTEFIQISAKTHAGLDDLKKKIGSLFHANVSYDSPIISRLRHKEALEKSLNSLAMAKDTLNQKLSFEFAAIDIKNATSALSEVVGEISSEHVLNNIFSSFCIGK